MTTFVKTWQQDFNRNCYDTSDTQGPTRSLLFYIKAFLTGATGGATQGLWTVYSSCDGSGGGDGVGFGNGSGVDYWTTTYTKAKLVRAAAGSNHSWIVLRSGTATPIYLIMDYAAATNDKAVFVWSKTAPTGGTATARPTAADEAALTAAVALQELSTTNHRINGLLSTDGSMFVIFSGKQGAGIMSFACMFATLANADPADQYPYLFTTYYSISGRGGFACTGAASGFGYMAPTTTLMKPHLGGATTLTKAGFIYSSSYTLNALANIPAAGDCINSKQPDWPIWVMAGDTGNAAIRGKIVDIAYASPNISIPTGEPNDSTPQSICVGDYWLPGTIVPLV